MYLITDVQLLQGIVLCVYDVRNFVYNLCHEFKTVGFYPLLPGKVALSKQLEAHLCTGGQGA